jgi:hypothetical protein
MQQKFSSIFSINYELLAADVRNFRRWLQKTLDADDADIENIFPCLSFS